MEFRNHLLAWCLQIFQTLQRLSNFQSISYQNVILENELRMWYALYSRVSFVLEFSHYDKRKFQALSYVRMHNHLHLSKSGPKFKTEVPIQAFALIINFFHTENTTTVRETLQCNCKKTKECLILRLETYAGISFKLKWFLKHLLFRNYCSFLET